MKTCSRIGTFILAGRVGWMGWADTQLQEEWPQRKKRLCILLRLMASLQATTELQVCMPEHQGPPHCKGHASGDMVSSECSGGGEGAWMIPGPRTPLCSGSVPSTQHPEENYLCIEDPRKTKISFLSHPRDDGFKSTLRKWGYIFLLFWITDWVFTYQTR